MRLSIRGTRRSFLASVAAITGFLATPCRTLASRASSTAVRGLGQSGDPYKDLGVATVINGWGTVPVLGGSLIRPEVETVMSQASCHFVRLLDLHAAAGKRIAEMLQLPSGYGALVTSGADR